MTPTRAYLHLLFVASKIWQHLRAPPHDNLDPARRHDEPEYYAPTLADGSLQGFLSYTPVINRALARPAGQMDIASHFAMINPQLTQLRAALLLAQRLNRLLVLPTLMCGLDRFWAPHNGTIPGSDTTLPIDPCPADHIIDLEHIARINKGTVETMLRESSFLSNPKLPASAVASKATLPPPPSLSETDLAGLRSSSARVLHFTSMPDLFATLDADEALSVQKRMLDWASIWCCTRPPSPKAAGHVFYDLFWDVIPHTTRHGKVVDSPWVPTLGP